MDCSDHWHNYSSDWTTSLSGIHVVFEGFDSAMTMVEKAKCFCIANKISL